MAISFFLTGCGPEAIKYSQQDIINAEESGRLETFYNKLKIDLDTGKTDKKYRPLLAETSNKIAQKRADRLSKSINGNRLKNGFIPLDRFNNFDQRLEDLAKWDQAEATKIKNRIMAEKNKTRAAIQSDRRKITKLADEQPIEALKLGKHIATLTGVSSDAQKQYDDLRQLTLFTQYERAVTAIEELRYEDATTFLNNVKQIDPNYKDLQSRYNQIAAGYFNIQFAQFLENGQVKEAYDSLIFYSDRRLFVPLIHIRNPAPEVW